VGVFFDAEKYRCKEVLHLPDCVENLERLVVEVSGEHMSTVLLYAAYATPCRDVDVAKDIHNVNNHLRSRSPPLHLDIIAGDLNARHSSWDANLKRGNTFGHKYRAPKRGNLLSDTFGNMGFKIFSGTSHEKSSLDIVATRLNGSCVDSVNPGKLTDHSPLLFRLNPPYSKEFKQRSGNVTISLVTS
jgi:hypothetical protein